MSMPAESLQMAPTLKALLSGIVAAPKIPVLGISSDSRKLRAGDVFFACQGALSHGLDFTAEALESGVVAIVFDVSTAQATDAPVPVIAVEHLAERLGEISNRFFDFPSQSLCVHGVTGTNGKTTVAYLLRESLRRLDESCGYVGTVGAGVQHIDASMALTTPPCFELQGLLADFVDAGAGHAAIEVSSHAIEQSRIDGIRFETATFTNLSRDHIDYHGDMRTYFETKARLFLNSDVTHRIVNIDDEFGIELARRCGTNLISVSIQKDVALPASRFVRAHEITPVADGFEVAVTTSWGDANLSLPLPGLFNVSNALQVLAVLLSQDVSLQRACAALSAVSAPPGRLQHVRYGSGNKVPAVYVDYSHTPASLELALQALRTHTRGQLWCVFGCGGDRDRGKRPMMGSIAATNADRAIVTNDNPRTENPATIIKEILGGMEAAALAIEDRDAAIGHAIKQAAVNDIVLLAGKGHEDYQIIGNQITSFSDYDVAKKYLALRAQEEQGTV